MLFEVNTMKNIKILVSVSGDPQNNYAAALKELGVEAVSKYAPPVDTNYDGLMLCGGCDVDPTRYGEENTACGELDAVRDGAEFALLEAFLKAGKPVFGICRGHQLINVFFGGSLYQHLSDTHLHRPLSEGEVIHEISALPESILGKLYGERFVVNSTHHQGVKKLGQGLVATAFWNGEVVEAIEHTEYPVFGVQFHPERMCFAHKREDTVSGALILEHFAELCKAHAREAI